MAYSGYELVPGTSIIKSVEAHCRHLTAGGTFAITGTPSLTRVEQWIDETYYGLQVELARAGYSPTIPASATAAIGFLERLNVYGAVTQVELAHPVTGRGGQPNDRYIAYKELYDQGITTLATDALEVMGATKSNVTSAYAEVGGISKSRKRVTYDDTDAVQARFRRNQGRSPLVIDPPQTPDGISL